MSRIAALITLALSCHAYSVEPRIEVGQVYSQYVGQSSSDTDWKFTAGIKDFPLYLFYDQETPEVRLLGQDLGYSDVQTIGLGLRYDATQKLSAFAEIGYSDTSTDVLYSTQQEIVATHLIDRHYIEGIRELPFSGPFHEPYGYDTEYTLDDGYSTRIGIAYQICRWASFKVSYKCLKMDEYMAVFDSDMREAGLGFWEERSTRDFDAIEFGVFLTY